MEVECGAHRPDFGGRVFGCYRRRRRRNRITSTHQSSRPISVAICNKNLLFQAFPLIYDLSDLCRRCAADRGCFVYSFRCVYYVMHYRLLLLIVDRNSSRFPYFQFSRKPNPKMENG